MLGDARARPSSPPARGAVSRGAAVLRRAWPAAGDGARPQGRPRGRRRPARCAVGESALALDLPTLIEGVDVAADGAVAPYEVARRLAADAWGARRTWFLTNGASQGNLAACLAIAQRGDARRRAAHRPRQHDRRPRSRGAAADLRRSRGRRRARPRALPDALRARRGARRHARRGGGDRRLSDLLRCCGRRRRPRPRCARPRRAARCRRGVGRAPGLLRRASAARAGRRRGPRHLEHAQARRQPDPVGDAPPRCAAGAWTRPPIDRALRLVTSTSPSSLLLASLDAARRHAALHGSELLCAAVAELAVLRDGDPRMSAASTSSTSAWSARSASRPSIRCACASTCARRGSAATRSRGGCAATATSTSSCAASTSSSPCSGSASGSPSSGAVLVEALARACAARDSARRRARTRALAPVRLAPPWGEVALSPRAAFLAAPAAGADRAGRGPDRGGVPGRLPARHPQRAARRAPDGGEPGHTCSGRSRTAAWSAAPPTRPCAPCSSWPSPRRCEAGGARLRLERAVA